MVLPVTPPMMLARPGGQQGENENNTAAHQTRHPGHWLKTRGRKLTTLSLLQVRRLLGPTWRITIAAWAALSTARREEVLRPTPGSPNTSEKGGDKDEMVTEPVTVAESTAAPAASPASPAPQAGPSDADKHIGLVAGREYSSALNMHRHLDNYMKSSLKTGHYSHPGLKRYLEEVLTVWDRALADNCPPPRFKGYESIMLETLIKKASLSIMVSILGTNLYMVPTLV